MSEANENPAQSGTGAVAMSPSIAKLAEALAKAQVDIKGAIKYSENPYFHSRYADLATVWDACREPLSKQGLAVIQTTDGGPDQVVILTTLAHSSGEWIRGRLVMKPVKADPQGIGSCLTYGRRYALAAIVGVAPEDDDGNAASAKPEVSDQRSEVNKNHKFEPRKADGLKQAATAGKLNPVNMEAAKDLANKTGVETVPEKLQTLMKSDKIELKELKAYCESKNFIPKDGKISDIKKEVYEQMIQDKNWKIVAGRIEESRKHKAA